MNDEMTINDLFSDPRMTRDIIEALFPTPGKLKSFLVEHSDTKVEWSSLDWVICYMVKLEPLQKMQEIMPKNKDIGKHIKLLKSLRNPAETFALLEKAKMLFIKAKCGVDPTMAPGEWSLTVGKAGFSGTLTAPFDWADVLKLAQKCEEALKSRIKKKTEELAATETSILSIFSGEEHSQEEKQKEIERLENEIKIRQQRISQLKGN